MASSHSAAPCLPLHSEEAGSHYILIMSVIYLQPIFPSESTQ